MDLKSNVLRMFLTFTTRYTPASEARMATLGGEGLEAKVWEQAGIPPDRGWLIERSRRQGRKLIKNHRYRTHNQLGTFSQILKGHGPEMGIDGFHLDLCGTFDKSVLGTFSSVLPLVLQSTGRCLAVTVADARRNKALEEWPSVMRHAVKLWGTDAERLFRHLENQQRRVPTATDSTFVKPFNPSKAAKREFALMVELLQLLRSQPVAFMPEKINRMIYVSRSGKSPFRMRTYFIRFGEAPDFSATAFAETWLRSSLWYARKEGFKLVDIPVLRQTRGDTTLSTQDSPLAQLVARLGGQEKAEYEDLVAAKQRLQKFEELLHNGNGSIPPRAKPGKVKSRGNGIHKNGAAKPGFFDLTPKDQLEWRLKAFARRVECLKTSTLYDWRAKVLPGMIREDFGRSKGFKEQNAGSLIARMSGKHRSKFIELIQRSLPSEEAADFLARFEKTEA
jgi:hypothetical protein